MNNFLKGFYKHAEALRKEVSTVAVMKDGKMLMGKRRDNGKWTTPGGHLDKGEEPLAGAVRELYEESGIQADPKDLKFIRTITNKENGYVVHGYRYDVSGKLSTSMKNDPDGEVYRWHFVNPDTIDDKDLHVPREKGNVLLGQEKVARRLPAIKYRKILKQIEDNFPEITKSEKLMTYPFQDKKRSDMEKEAFLKGLGKGLLAASLTAGTAMPAKALSVGNKATSNAARAAYKEVKRNKDVLKNKLLPSKATKEVADKGSAVAPAISKEKGVMERAYEGLKETDSNLQKNYGLKIRDKVEKTFDGGKVSLKDLGRSASVDYKGLGADYNKGNLRLRGKINDNTSFTLDPKNKGVSLAWNKSF